MARKLIGTAEAGEQANLSQRRIALLCERGRIPGAQRVGRAWAVPDGFAITPRGPGRPKGKLRRHDSYDTAVHEAGHAVLANEFGIYLDPVSIRPDADSAGWILAESTYGASRELLAKHACMLYGGHAAIVVLLRKGDMTDSSAKLYGAGSDFAKADSHLSNDAKRIFAVRKRAVTIVKRRREDIDRLARVLMEHKVLEGQQIECAMHWGTRDWPFGED